MRLSPTQSPSFDELRPSRGVRYLMLAVLAVLALDVVVVFATLAAI